MAKVYSTEYSRYTDHFKQLAVLLSYQPDMLALEVAEKLGIHPIMLYRWRLEVKQQKNKGEIIGDGFTVGNRFAQGQPMH